MVGTESPAFTTKTFTDGVFDADNIVFSAVTGNTVEAIVLFVDTGVPATVLYRLGKFGAAGHPKRG